MLIAKLSHFAKTTIKSRTHRNHLQKYCFKPFRLFAFLKSESVESAVICLIAKRTHH